MKFLKEEFSNYTFLIAYNEEDDFGVKEVTTHKKASENYKSYLERVINIAKSTMQNYPQYTSADIYELIFGEDDYYEEDNFVTHVERD